MKKSSQKRSRPRTSEQKEEVRTLMKCAGKLVHGTRGKPTRGARGNKR
jgi:hypothetical protein